MPINSNGIDLLKLGNRSLVLANTGMKIVRATSKEESSRVSFSNERTNRMIICSYQCNGIRGPGGPLSGASQGDRRNYAHTVPGACFAGARSTG